MDERQATFPCYRHQLDAEAALEARRSSVVECTEAENKARPEFLKDTLIENVIRRHVPMPVPSGEVDFDLDLRSAFAAVQETKDTWLRLPRDVRAKYRTWDALFEAVRSGQLKPKEVAEVSSAASGGLPSDSAAGVPPKGDAAS